MQLPRAPPSREIADPLLGLRRLPCSGGHAEAPATTLTFPATIRAVTALLSATLLSAHAGTETNFASPTALRLLRLCRLLRAVRMIVAFQTLYVLVQVGRRCVTSSSVADGCRLLGAAGVILVLQKLFGEGLVLPLAPVPQCGGRGTLVFSASSVASCARLWPVVLWR